MNFCVLSSDEKGTNFDHESSCNFDIAEALADLLDYDYVHKKVALLFDFLQRFFSL